MIKLIVADLDGTLVEDKIVSENVKNTIKKLEENGYLFTIATGRHIDGTKDLANELNITIPVICGNGSFIGNHRSMESIYVNALDSFTVEQICRKCDEMEIDYLMYTKDNVFGTIVSKNKLIDRIGDMPITIIKREQMLSHKYEDVIKILIIEYNIKKFQLIKEKLAEISGIYVASSSVGFVDAGKSDNSKGNALGILCKHLNIDITDVIAIGDQENDISMIEQAGIGVAMGNGVEGLKEKADFITKTCSEDGFSFAMERLLFNKQ